MLAAPPCLVTARGGCGRRPGYGRGSEITAYIVGIDIELGPGAAWEFILPRDRLAICETLGPTHVGFTRCSQDSVFI
jgi:hypothetical protein